eukprot:TRINITY_DN2882_c0_g1_i1.p1 TRINITY_DN2882_c0_g1~~TRINITY_DN2882_c0_g1_i1.p1  ORF type:complete len:430 (-),score=42.54 TRINITY_DN2882_c0_g1_i1:547-1836(-)
MGFEQSKFQSVIYDEAIRYYSPQEVEKMKSTYKTSVRSPEANKQQTMELLGLHKVNEALMDVIYRAIAAVEQGTSVIFHKLIIAKHFTETCPEKFLLLMCVVSSQSPENNSNHNGYGQSQIQASKSQLEKVLKLVVCTQFGFEGKWIKSFCDRYDSWDEENTKKAVNGELRCFREVLHGLLQNFPRTAHRLVINDKEFRVPNLEVDGNYKGLLCPEWSWMISFLLPPSQRQNWTLLFSSERNGASFNAFMGRASEQGPTVIIIREKGGNGNVFGAYASESWEKKGQFYGSHSNFLFRLSPSFEVFNATGFNTNFQWCGHNFKELPNGFGFGGQIGYYGLYVDGQFEKGMSRAVATFQNKSLSSTEEFVVDVVECWQVEKPQEDDLGNGKPGMKKSKSILEKQVEDQNLMELAGKKLYTRDLHDEPLEDE